MLRYWPASQWLKVAGLSALIQPLGARLAIRLQPATSATKGGANVASARVARLLTASSGVVGAIVGASWVAVTLVGPCANGLRFRAIVSTWQRNWMAGLSRVSRQRSDERVGEEQRRHVVGDHRGGTREGGDLPDR